MSSKLTGSTVNIKWYGKLDYMLDIHPEAVPDYFLVLTGPKSQPQSSRGVKIGVATSVQKYQ